MTVIAKCRQHKEIIILSFLVLLAYLSTLSCSLDDWDSVNFALGLKDFDVTRHQPHPPGYPVYIFLGKTFYFLLGDELRALTALSAVSGVLTLIFSYFLIRGMHDRKTALMSTVILSVTPIFWINSVEAMSDMPALCSIAVLLYALDCYRKSGRGEIFCGVSFFFGVFLGIRLHSFFFLLPVLILVGWEKRFDIKAWLSSGVLFCAGVGSWLLPTVIFTGFWPYADRVWTQFHRRIDRPAISLLGSDWGLDFLSVRAKEFLEYFLASGYGILTKAMDVLSVIFLVLSVVLLICSLRVRGNKYFRYLVVGSVFYSLMVFILLPPANPRYLLPLLLVFTPLFVLGMQKIRMFTYGIWTLFFILILSRSVPLAIGIHRDFAPPVQMIRFINSNYDSKDTVLIVSGSARKHFRYYQTNILAYESGRISEKTIKYFQSLGKTVLITSDDRCEPFELKLIKEFKRDIRIHVKHNTESLYEIARELP